MSEITEIEVGPMKVVGMRKKSVYRDVGTMMPELFNKMTAAGLKIGGAPLYLCHELTLEEVQRTMDQKDADFEVGIPFEGRIPRRGDLKGYTILGGRMARIVHKGPYQQVGETYAKLFEWMAQNGKQVKGPYREIYLNNPMEVAPEELLTEIHAPI